MPLHQWVAVSGAMRLISKPSEPDLLLECTSPGPLSQTQSSVLHWEESCSPLGKGEALGVKSAPERDSARGPSAMDKGDERRLKKRWRTVLKGQIMLNNRSSVLDCTVKNLSDIGANLVFADVSLLPQDFELDIPSRNLRVQARLIWSRGATHGVMFVHPDAD